MGRIEARSWTSFIGDDAVNAEVRYKKALVQLAIIQATEGDLQPEVDDAEETFNAVVSGAPPTWWPPKLDRMFVEIRATPVGNTTEKLGPTPIDPNNRSLGCTLFLRIVEDLLDSTGGSFEGNVEIRILRATDKQRIGGVNVEVFIGESSKRKNKKSAESEGGIDRELVEYMADQLEKRDRTILGAMQASTGLVNASAQVINATRGVNAPAPWMQNGDGEASPLWLTLVQGAMGVVTGALAGQSPAKQIGNLMQQPVNHPMLADGGVPQPQPQQQGHRQMELGTDQYLDEGQWDSYAVAADDILDDELELEEFEEDEDEYEEEEEEDEEEEEEEEEEELPRRRNKRKSSPKKAGNPLEGASPAQVEEWLSQFIDKNSDKKQELTKLGMGLANKLMR